MKFSQPIAIVGMGGVFPGGLDFKSFWNTIVNAKDMSKEPPVKRWMFSPDEIYDTKKGTADKVYSKKGCFIENFQPDFRGLNIDLGTIEKLDMLFQLVLHAGNLAFQDAKTQNLNRDRVKVIIGNIVLPSEKSSQFAAQILGPTWEQHVLGHTENEYPQVNPLDRYVAGLPGGLLAKALGLGAGSYTLDAACASSLYALKLAADELLNYRVDAVLTGGLSRPDCLYTQMGFAQLHALSATGKCSPFDAKGDGLVVGEGCGIFVLKRLEDALRDKDHIYGNIVGAGLSNDVGGNLLSPDSKGQLQALKTAYQEAGWNPTDVDLIECHATGTPVGDAKEFESLSTLWSDHDWQKNQCVIGSVKSNIGHLLTAAGAAGLAKILLSFQHKVLPPTANFSTPKKEIDLSNSPFRVLTTQQPWKKRDADTPRRAAINAFGFGGINAHILLEEWDNSKDINITFPPQNPPPTIPIAIVGMDAHFGEWDSLQRFQHRVLGGEPHCASDFPKNWWGIDKSLWFLQEGWERFPGYYIDQLAIPMDRYRISPNELKEMLPQQSLMLQVATKAVADAKLKKHGKTGVFMGIGLDVNTTNFYFRWHALQKALQWVKKMDASEKDKEKWIEEIMASAGEPLTANRTMGALGGIVASRIARELNVANSSFTISSEETSGLSALGVAIRSLQSGDLDAAIVGAVDLAGDIRAVLAAHQLQPFATSGKNIPFTKNAIGSLVGEGAAAVVLKRLDDAAEDHDKIYAVIRGIGTATGSGDNGKQKAYTLAVERAYAEANIDSKTIGYLETHGSGSPEEDAIEMNVANSFFGQQKSSCAIGSVKADIGHTGAASGMASFVKTVLCLQQQVIPALRNKKEVCNEFSQNESLLFPKDSQYWLHDRNKGARRAAVSGLSMDGNAVHIVLEEYPQTVASNSPLGIHEEMLFCIEANTVPELLQGLQNLESLAQSAVSFSLLAKEWWKTSQNSKAQLAVTIIAEDKHKLLQKIVIAKDSLCKESFVNIEKEKIFYTSNPLANKGEVAFVFPGSGNHYCGAGRQISITWPQIFRRQNAESKYLRSQFLPEMFWNSEELPDNNHQALIFGQVTMGVLVSDVLHYFGLHPQAVIGYSLGESIGIFALRAWNNRDEMLQRINNTSLFTNDLAGTCESVKKAWQTQDKIDWIVGIVNRSCSDVKQGLQNHDKAYLFIVNNYNECVIGGDRNSVANAVAGMGCNFFPLSGITTVHCEVVKPVAEAYKDLHVFPITAPPEVRFYSAAWGESYSLESEKTAESILTQAVEGFDFSKVIENAYKDGVRIFLEMGPGNSCTRMIRNILSEREHFAGAACFPGSNEVTTILTLLAKLVTHRVPVDLQKLYENVVVEPVSATGSEIIIAIGKSAWRTIARLPQKVIKSQNPQVSNKPKSTLGDSEINRTITSKAPEQKVVQSLAPLPVMTTIIEQAFNSEQQAQEAHSAYLKLSQNTMDDLARMISFQMELMSNSQALPEDFSVETVETFVAEVNPEVDSVECLFPRPMCMEFAIGSIAKVFGSKFADADTYPTRVRLPDEPLMLVDRITHIEGEPCSLTSGRVVTEHDILHNAWYLDNNRIPVCIAVESGQADLLLSGYLGIDFKTKGLAVYRLLDAEVTFHRHLPGPGETIEYDIKIIEFFRQGETYLFRFEFESTVNGVKLLTMKKGCAGFFTVEALNQGKGIVHTKLDLQPQKGKQPNDWLDLVPMRVESYSDKQVNCLRSGDLAGCFGSEFAHLNIKQPPRLPSGKMNLVDRVLHIDPTGGQFGLGIIKSQADIAPDDWFLTCHFIDDQVMPGTLMYECSLHTLRIFLLRMGWVSDHDKLVYEPIPGVSSQLKCRGQVIASTKKAAYQVTIKEKGYNPHPYVIADAILFSDDKAIVKISNMSVQLTGLARTDIEKIWTAQPAAASKQKTVLYNYDKIYAFSNGKPSEAFGEPYRIFDSERIIARLPRPPYQFLDRVIAVEGEPWKMKAGSAATAEYDVPENEWYFTSNNEQGMPFAILLEIALQPCGWLAAYVGSALTSNVDLSFRNLGGEAIQYQNVTHSQTLETTVKMTNVSHSGGMIIQHYSLDVRCEGEKVYEGKTYFGFFSKGALADQVGIQDSGWYIPTNKNMSCFAFPQHSHFPTTQMKMVDEIEIFLPQGGKHNLGFIQGTKKVNPEEWFFAAHFFQDAVCPGSLGLESFLQILKVLANERWQLTSDDVFETIALGEKHQWVYRGQILPVDNKVTVQATITFVDDDERLLRADGYLGVDGRIIYQMKNFSLKVKNNL